MQPVPEALLDGIASRPEEVGVWEVLTDYLLEQDAPGATLARCDLELFRGISNPDLLGALADARSRRPRLPFEPYGGYDAIWRCGFVVRLHLSSRTPGSELTALLAAPALQGLHHLRFEDLSARGRSLFDELENPQEVLIPMAQQLSVLTSALPRHLRRFSLHLEERSLPLLSHDLSDVLEVLTTGLPRKLERVDLSLAELGEASVDPLIALARRVKVLNLDGTKLTALQETSVARLLESAPGCTFFLGGTGLSPRELVHPRAEWLAPDVVAWLENERGMFTPLTPSTPHDGFHSPSWPDLARYLKRELLGWSRRDGSMIDDRALLLIDGEVWKFSSRGHRTRR